MVVCADSSASKGMILRRGSGEVKHFIAKQLWVKAQFEHKDRHPEDSP